MTIEDFDIEIKNFSPHVYDCSIKHKHVGPKFTTLVQSNVPPSPPWILHQFITNRKNFCIEIDVVIAHIDANTANTGSV